MRLKKIIISAVGWLLFMVSCLICFWLHEDAQDTKDTLVSYAASSWNNEVPKFLDIKSLEGDVYYRLRLDSLAQITKITPYLRGKKDGTEIYLGDGNILAFINYLEGNKDGFVYEFYPNGQILHSMFCKRGEVDGVVKAYYPNGQVEDKKHYVAGKRHGMSERYYENGNIEEKGLYENDLAEGEWFFYYPSGKLKASGSYKAGVRQDDWGCWDEEGELISCKRIFAKY